MSLSIKKLLSFLISIFVLIPAFISASAGKLSSAAIVSLPAVSVGSVAEIGKPVAQVLKPKNLARNVYDGFNKVTKVMKADKSFYKKAGIGLGVALLAWYGYRIGTCSWKLYKAPTIETNDSASIMPLKFYQWSPDTYVHYWDVINNRESVLEQLRKDILLEKLHGKYLLFESNAVKWLNVQNSIKAELALIKKHIDSLKQFTDISNYIALKYAELINKSVSRIPSLGEMGEENARKIITAVDEHIRDEPSATMAGWDRFKRIWRKLISPQRKSANKKYWQLYLAVSRLEALLKIIGENNVDTYQASPTILLPVQADKSNKSNGSNNRNSVDRVNRNLQTPSIAISTPASSAIATRDPHVSCSGIGSEGAPVIEPAPVTLAGGSSLPAWLQKASDLSWQDLAMKKDQFNRTFSVLNE